LQIFLKTARQANTYLGRILIEESFISQESLENIIRQQTEDMIFRLFLWDQGEFEYKDARLNLSGMVVTRLNVMTLLLEASRRIDEMSILKKHIPNEHVIFKMSEKIQSKNNEIKLTSEEWQILKLIDGKHSVKQVVHSCRFDPLDVFKILYALLSSGLIEACGQARDGKHPAEDRDYSVIITIYLVRALPKAAMMRT
jgi:hypothetical protein